MKRNRAKYSEVNIINKIIVRGFPDLLQHNFKRFDESNKDIIKVIIKVLQKIKRCEHLDGKMIEKKQVKKPQEKCKPRDKSKQGGKYKNACPMLGQDHKLVDCPDNWKNKKK